MEGGVHEEDVSTIVAWLHAAGEYYDDWAFSVKADAEAFPEGQG